MTNPFLKRILERDSSILISKKGFPDVGKRQDGAEFSDVLRPVLRCWKSYDYELYNQSSLFSRILNFATGNPIKEKSYPLSCSIIKKVLDEYPLFEYQSVAGHNELRKKIVPYIKYLGIGSKEKVLSEDNIISTVSTTQAFSIILDVIARPYDVVLFTAPTYGLFLFMPERINACVDFLPLEKQDDWFINPIKLEKKIKEINTSLKRKYVGIG